MGESPLYQTKVNPPFQARKVDAIMRSRKGLSELPDSGENSSTSQLPNNRESSKELSTTAQLEQLPPRDLKSWLEFRVRYMGTTTPVVRCPFVMSGSSQRAIANRHLDSEGIHLLFLKSRPFCTRFHLSAVRGFDGVARVLATAGSLRVVQRIDSACVCWITHGLKLQYQLESCAKQPE